MTAPVAGHKRLELRVDMDASNGQSVVTKLVSGDVYEVDNTGEAPLNVYESSWIVKLPVLTTDSSETHITGPVVFWKSSGVSASIDLHIPTAGPATVTLTSGGVDESYTCARCGDAFREVTVEVDVCTSVAPIRLPDYDITSHPDHPSDLATRRMTLEDAYNDAGVKVTVRNDGPEIKDDDPEFESWSPAELHDKMVTSFADAPSDWPRWSLWALIAGTNGVDAGFMFDQVSPQRQGFAIFRVPAFAKLPPGRTSTSPDELAALRLYLFTWVHEMGHAFNMVHSADKYRSMALSWMNEPTFFAGGAFTFWTQFPFQFDMQELEHIRHGDMSAVIMGGDPWGSDGHLRLYDDLDSPDGMSAYTDPRLELLARASTQFDFMTPVRIELRLRNRSASPVPIDARLQCQDGNVTVLIRRLAGASEGNVARYVPMTRRLREAVDRELAPATEREPFSDRYSEELDLTYGRKGFYFDKPGGYQVQAIYRTREGRVVQSNTLQLTVASPDAVGEKLSQDFFTHVVGKCLYLQGSQSRHLTKGMDTLLEVVKYHSQTEGGARLVEAIATGIAEPFFSVEHDKVVRVKPPDRKAALEFTTDALSVLETTNDKALNLVHGRLGVARVRWRRALDDVEGAEAELKKLVARLGQRGVHQSVLDELARVANTVSLLSQSENPRTTR
jgi:hypothetical protein